VIEALSVSLWYETLLGLNEILPLPQLEEADEWVFHQCAGRLALGRELQPHPDINV
jgi:hypothetical protein